MSLNIRYNNPGDGPNAWPHRSAAVAQLLLDERVDIVGMQEALPDQIADLAEQLPDYTWYGVGREDGRERGEFVPVFYRTQRLEALDQGVFWLSETPDVPGSKSWDTAITRCTVWLKMKDRQTDHTFYLFNTHFDHRGQEARRQSAQLMMRRIDQLAGQAPLIVTGDFNCRPEDPPYAVLTGKADSATNLAPLRDAYHLTETPHEGPDSSWNGFQAIVPGQRIDYIFVRGPVTVRRHRILTKQVDNRFLSDHLPVVADVVVTAR